MNNKRALLVGLNNYDHMQPLCCSVDDARAMEALLARHADGGINYDCMTLTSEDGRLTVDKLRQWAERLLSDLRGGDALFYFSGHGAISETGAYLLTQEAVSGLDGLAMSDLLQMANDSGVGSVLLILDCCHSGAICDDVVTLNEGVTILAASRAQQESQEGMEHSVFTDLVLDALSGGAADVRGHVSAASVYAYVEQALGAWDQRPMYKSYARSLSPIRKCSPVVPDANIKRLAELFFAPDAKLPMDPSYERTEQGHVAENVEKFDCFKVLRNGGLLRTTDGRDLYYAAIQSGQVELTPLGRFYWEQVRKGRI